jgi:DNA ligase-1
MKTWPTLYQKTATGAIQSWEISTTGNPVAGAAIIIEFGHHEGKKQVLRDSIRSGKNVGRANETTPEQQAEAEAEAKWTKQKKKGYVESIEAAIADKVDSSVIMGGVEPMLAPNKSYPKDNEVAKRIKFPCSAQPKLDGMRCVAVIEDGVATLWSRTRKPIPTVPHIVEELQRMFPSRGKRIIDGELYNHDYRNSFEDLISILRKDAPDSEGLHRVVEYHVYDYIHRDAESGGDVISMTTPFEDRIASVFLDLSLSANSVKPVLTNICMSLDELVAFYERCIDLEYEGAMARNNDGIYASGKRSVDLQKMKPFLDAEFPIIGVNEGRGKDEGTAATFTCVTPEGKEFRARLKATYAYRKQLLQQPELWRGKKLTVTLKRMTNYGIPYIPVAKTIRDYE